MKIGDVIQFRHRPTGAVRTGVVAAFPSDYPAIVHVLVEGSGSAWVRTLAVHRSNIVSPTTQTVP